MFANQLEVRGDFPGGILIPLGIRRSAGSSVVHDPKRWQWSKNNISSGCRPGDNLVRYFGRVEVDAILAEPSQPKVSREVSNAKKIAYPLAELNDLLTAASGEEIEKLPAPSIADPYRLNYATAMVELAAHKAGVVPPLWTSEVEPLSTPVFFDSSLNLRAYLLTASPPPFRRPQYFY